MKIRKIRIKNLIEQKNVILIVVVFAILCVIFAFYYIAYYNNIANKVKIETERTNINRKKFDQINNYLFERKEEEIVRDMMFKEREIMILENENGLEIFIGNSKKEIENDFYDIKIVIKSEKERYNFDTTIYINKLWKMKVVEGKIVDEIYVSELVDALQYIFFMNYEEAEIKEIYKYIIKQYLNVKDKNISDEIKIKILEDYENNKIKFKNISENNIFILKFIIKEDGIKELVKNGIAKLLEYENNIIEKEDEENDDDENDEEDECDNERVTVI